MVAHRCPIKTSLPSGWGPSAGLLSLLSHWLGLLLSWFVLSSEVKISVEVVFAPDDVCYGPSWCVTLEEL